mgnify:CR=1 FL=1
MNKDEFENKTLDENDFREVVAENNQVIDNNSKENDNKVIVNDDNNSTDNNNVDKVRMVIHQTRVMKMNTRRFVMFVDDLKVKQEL